jgi:hypothetical protein
MLTYILFKTKSMFLSATRKKGQMLTYILFKTQSISNKQEGPASLLTYNLFKSQSMLLSGTSTKGQPDADLHPIQIPEHALVSNKQEGPASC